MSNYEISISNSKVLCNTNSNNSIYLHIPPEIVEIYYGVNSLPTVTEETITTTFSTETGYIGSSNGRLYTFPGGYNYKYWCIPDSPNDGYRVVEVIKNGSGIVTTLAYDSYYQYYQLNPTPQQSISYGKLDINGTTYRIYRTIIKSSLNYEQYVYSF
jgi:hypothetical protein